MILIKFSNSFFPDGPTDVKSKGGLKTVGGSVKRDSITSTKTQKKEPWRICLLYFERRNEKQNLWTVHYMGSRIPNF